MMVTLAILAAVATIALRSANGLQNQARYQQTTHQLNEIQNAILGAANLRGADGSAQVSGFVADIGRLPNFHVSTNDPLYGQTDAFGNPLGDPLDELLERPTGVPQFSFVAAVSDPGVVIGVGWQGPYLRLGAGPSVVRDGWGNSFHVYDGSGNLVKTDGNSIAQLSSWGADKVPDINHGGSGDTTGYNADVATPSTGAFAATGTLVGRVTMNVASDLVGPNTGNNSGPNPNQTVWDVTSSKSKNVAIWVCYYAPKADGTVDEHPVLVADANATNGQTGYWPTAVANGFQFSIPNATIGPRVIRAYVLLDPPSPALSTFSTTTAVSAHTVSLPLTVTAVGGGQNVPTLILPHYSP